MLQVIAFIQNSKPHFSIFSSSCVQLVLMAQLPPLPRIDNPELYTIHNEPMPLQIRRTYIKDRKRNTHMYIMEYSATLEMIKER